jgi:phage terminase large subunit-like protein
MVMSRDDHEEYLIVAEALAERRAADPLRGFPLHAKQRAFVDSVLYRIHKENWFIAANRSGKSDAGAYIGATLARFGRQDARPAPHGGAGVQVIDRSTSGWVSALDFPTSRDVIQPKYFDNGYRITGKYPPFIPKHEIDSWNSESQVLKLKNGSLIGFKSAESGRRKYQGADKDWFHMDEEHPWEIYEESVIRVGAFPLIFFCTATILPPEGVSVTTSWVFPKIIQPWQSGQSPGIGLFGASIYDNPGIPRDEIARLESIYPEGSASRRIRLGGEWLPGLAGARAYHGFDRQIHVAREMPEISMRRPLCWTWDFNVSPMVSVVSQIDGPVYRFYKELILQEGSIPEMCDMFYHAFPVHGSEIWLYGDATGGKRMSQTGESDYWTVLNEMKQYGSPIRMKVPTDNPRVPDRVNAVNRLLRDEDGQVRIQVDHNCVDLIADFEGVLRDGRGGGGILKIRNRKDPYFHRTHTSDAVGYQLAFEEPIRPHNPRGSNRHVPTGLSGPGYSRGH